MKAPNAVSVSFNQETKELSRCFYILQCLKSVPRGQPVADAVLLDAMKATGSLAEDPERALRITVCRLRNKLPEHEILRVRNLGYALFDRPRGNDWFKKLMLQLWDKPLHELCEGLLFY